MAEALAKIKDNAIFPATTGDTDGSLLTNLIEALTAGAQLNVGQKGRVTHTAVNYTAATQIVDDHLAGIDTAFGGKASSTHKDTHKSGGGDALTSSDLLEAVVKRLQVTGPVTLLLGAVADGKFLKRSGTGIVGDDPPGMSAHALGGSYHSIDTLANLNAKVTGGDLDFDTAARPPTAHKDSHKSAGSDPFASTDLLEAVVKRLQITGPVTLLIGAVADGAFLKRSGTGLIGADPVPSTSKVRAYLSGNQDIPSGTYTTVEFDTETYDVLGDFNTGTHRFVAPVTGYYLVNASVRGVAPSGCQWILLIYRSGVEMSRTHIIAATGYPTLAIHDVVYMTASQYVSIAVYHDSGVTRPIDAGTLSHLEVVRLL